MVLRDRELASHQVLEREAARGRLPGQVQLDLYSVPGSRSHEAAAALALRASYHIAGPASTRSRRSCGTSPRSRRCRGWCRGFQYRPSDSNVATAREPLAGTVVPVPGVPVPGSVGSPPPLVAGSSRCAVGLRGRAGLSVATPRSVAGAARHAGGADGAAVRRGGLAVDQLLVLPLIRYMSTFATAPSVGRGRAVGARAGERRAAARRVDVRRSAGCWCRRRSVLPAVTVICGLALRALLVGARPP